MSLTIIITIEIMAKRQDIRNATTPGLIKLGKKEPLPPGVIRTRIIVKSAHL